MEDPVITIEMTKQVITGNPEIHEKEIEPETEITIGKRKYKVLIADTEEKREKGLQDVTEMDDDEGMLFIHEKPEHVDYWMKDCYIPLSIIFMDEDGIVLSIKKGEPESEEYLSEDNVKYVLEVNPTDKIKVGDEMDYEDDEDKKFDEESAKMYIVGPNGKPQMYLEGGERIVSIKQTRTLLKKVNKAKELKTESAYKTLGKYMFKVLDEQDNREPDYVILEDNKKAE